MRKKKKNYNHNFWERGGKRLEKGREKGKQRGTNASGAAKEKKLIPIHNR